MGVLIVIGTCVAHKTFIAIHISLREIPKEMRWHIILHVIKQPRPKLHQAFSDHVEKHKQRLDKKKNVCKVSTPPKGGFQDYLPTSKN